MLVQQRSLKELIEAGGRFTIQRQLGSGGMGVVYAVHDRQLDTVVALKTLRWVNPDSLFMFKQEFRALADVTHPNLVTLYELVVADGEWFFTMELLAGVNILAYVRGERPQPPDRLVQAPGASTATATATATASISDQTSPTACTPTSGDTTSRRPARPVAADQLRPVMLQLVDAISALHATGHLHCDIKPSNVLVEDNGRVVVLDYGVITEMAGPGAAGDDQFRGTPAYAAPEQAAGITAPSPASDWYSVGVILYEGLTGQRPFVGSAESVLAAKQAIPAPAPQELHPGVDPALAELCSRLLARDPAVRPAAAEIRAVLSDHPQVAPYLSDPIPDDCSLVGRSSELIAMRKAFDNSRRGYGTAIRVKGRSGMGKTALVTHFLAAICEHDQALVLAGRCYERESVPHQAVDGLVDALCRYLIDLPRQDADSLMPVDVLAMARAFPVLARVEAVAKARRRSNAAVTDPMELRQRAYAALRELFARIAERQPLVLFIDDLQWGDVDSAPFLADLLRAPAPPLLLIVTYRSEEREASALLRTLLDSAGDTDDTLASAAEIHVGRLALVQARELAGALLQASDAATASADEIARESAGNPFFVHELVRWVTSNEAATANTVPALAQVILSRTSALAATTQKLLGVVAVAGKPILESVARRAANIGEHYPRAVAELRTAHLIRTSGAVTDLALETFHDRIRESLVGSMEEVALAVVHRHIAESLEVAAQPDLEALASHYSGAGERKLAGEYAALAAHKADDALAFERAAELYALALELAEDSAAERRALLGRHLGDALVNAGRGNEAPDVYLAAAALAPVQDALDLNVRAGSELLRAGRVDAGVAVLRPALESAGITLARSKGRAAMSLLFRRGYSRLRGLGFSVRSEHEVAPQVLTVIDACHAAAAGLAMVDPLRGAYVQTRHLMLALRNGDLFRIGRALTYEGGFLCIGGQAKRARVDKILRTVSNIAEELDEPYLFALQHSHAALSEYQCGAWAKARDHAQTAETTYRDQCTGSGWELASVQLYGLWSLYWLGDYGELVDRAHNSLRDARARGDLYATVSLSSGLPSFAGLVADDVARTLGRARAAAQQWPHDDYHLQHFWTAVALAHCELYAGDPVAASERMAQQWPALKRAFLLGVVMVRAETLHLRARCALAAAALAATDERKHYIAITTRLTKQLRRQKMAWCQAAATLLQAGLEQLAGNSAAAVEKLAAAETALHAADTHGLAWAAARRRGVLIAGDAGDELVAASDAWMKGEKVANPARMTAFLAPGFAG